jgi:nucleoid DNA-binding protein
MNKRDTIAAIGQATRMRNHDIQTVLEALLQIWTEELASGGRIEIEHFLVLEVQTIQPQGDSGTLLSQGRVVKIPPQRRRLTVRPSKYLRSQIRLSRTGGGQE